MGEARIPFVARHVYYAYYDDDGELVEGNEKNKRSRKYADGWFLNETELRTAVPIVPSVARDMFTGDCDGIPELMQRCWAESDEKRGARIVESTWGSIETHEFTFGGDLTPVNPDWDDMEYEPDDRIVIVRFRVRGKECTNGEIDMLKKDSDGSSLGVIATIEWDSPRGSSGLVGEVIKENQAVSPSVQAAGGARDVVIHMDYVRIG